MRQEIPTVGKVFIVGAGPGDPGLLTIKGKACLEAADVVLFDYLANPCLLDYVAPEAERIYVGRRGRGAYRSQTEINTLLVQKAREGKCVIRLKGGDPFLFGRGGEEAEVVQGAGIPYEVVPGVPSAIAVPAYAGIPVTHRTMASQVTFVTGHEDPTKEQSAVEWPRLATSDGTLIFLMGTKHLPVIVERLRAEGKLADTPVAVIRWGTYSSQQTVIGTLADIVTRVREADLQPPTVIVVGSVVGLRRQLNWFEARPLLGTRILVTRPKHQAAALSNVLAAYGAHPVEFSMLTIVNPVSWDDTDRAIHRLSSYHWLVLTSVNGVRAFMERLRFHQKDIRSLAGLRLCCIGPQTAAVALQYGIQADVVPGAYQAEGVIEVLKAEGIEGQRVLIPRAEVAREILPEQLRQLGAEVDVVATYRAIAPVSDVAEVKRQLEQGEIDVVTFASSSTVRNFCELFDDRAERLRLLDGVTIACIGPITAQTVVDEGLRVGVVAKSNTIPALVEAIVHHACPGYDTRHVCVV